jgi:hypothetical protein
MQGAIVFPDRLISLDFFGYLEFMLSEVEASRKKVTRAWGEAPLIDLEEVFNGLE